MKRHIIVLILAVVSGTAYANKNNEKSLETSIKDLKSKFNWDIVGVPFETDSEDDNEETDDTNEQSSNTNLLQLVKNSFAPLASLLLGGTAVDDPVSTVSRAFLDVLAAENETECVQDQNAFTAGLNKSEIWAMSMLDAAGKIESNLLGGNFKWLGNKDECDRVKAVVDGVEQFTGKYCRVSLRLNFMPDVIKALGGNSATLGTCVSNRCSGDEVKLIMKTAFQNLAIDVRVNNVWCQESREVGSDVIGVICFLAFLGTLVVVGTLYDMYDIQEVFKTKEKKGYTSFENPKGDTSFENPPPYEATAETTVVGKLSSNYGNSLEKTEEVDKRLICENGYGTMKSNRITPFQSSENVPVDKRSTTETTTKKPTQGVISQILLSFSVYTNGCKLLSATQGAGTLGAINGIRFLSMAWVILGHSYSFAQSYASNRGVIAVYYERWTFCALFFATVSVDSFFVLSGVLVAYLTLKELKRVGGAKKFNWAMFYFHRFWRLTPPYMLVLMVGTVIWPYFSTGAQFLTNDKDTPNMMKWCRENWWTNLLYVNNYVKTKETCMGWSWYLANDMQFYIISPLILLPLFYNVIAGGVSSLVFMIATLVTTAVIVHEHEYPAQNGPGVPQAKDNDSFRNIYQPSYARMGPYIVGLLTGYLLYRMKCKCRIPRLLNIFLWLISLFLCCIIVYGPFIDGGNNVFTNLESTMYSALSRTGWGVAVCWVIFACATGNGGWINQLLSWSPFVPLGRLSYCAYLIHPIVMVLYFENRAHAIYFSNYDLIYMFLGHMALTYGASFIVSLLFESPMMGLEKAIIKRNKK